MEYRNSWTGWWKTTCVSIAPCGKTTETNSSHPRIIHNSGLINEFQASPFEVNLGWKPKSPLCMSIPSNSQVEYANEFKFRIDSALPDTRFLHKLSKYLNAAYVSQKSEPPSYSVGDLIWLNRSIFRDSISRGQNSDKSGLRGSTCSLSSPLSERMLLSSSFRTIWDFIPWSMSPIYIYFMSNGRIFLNRFSLVYLRCRMTMTPVYLNWTRYYRIASAAEDFSG